MVTHSPSSEFRHEPPQPLSEKEHTTSIPQTLLDILLRYGNESLAEAWLVAQRWPNGVHCPQCDSDNVARSPDSKPMPYRCRNCRTQFSVKSHSALRSSKHSVGTWVQALHLCSAVSNPDAADMRDILPVTNKASWNLAMRIHEAWEFYGRESHASNPRRQLSLDPSFTGQQGVQIARRRSTRPRRALPPPINYSAQVLAKAMFSLPEHHTWVFMRGKSFRD